MTYSYRGSDGSLVKVESADDYLLAYNLTYDDLARMSTRTNSYFAQTYAYKANGSNTTTQVQSIAYTQGAAEFTPFTLTYGYDALGNIGTITNSVNANDNRTYTYDVQGQMLTEKIGSQTNSYSYDSYGNLRTAVVDGTTHTYTYGDSDWKDLLTAYDGQAISYDEIGNPTSYNGTRWTFDWEKGRQLVSAESSGHEVTYTYDLAGIRDSKTVDGVTYHYDTLNGKVVRQTWTENGTEHVLDIIYDASGQPYGCVYDGTRLYYVLNQQGDVVRIVGYLGKTCAEYRYDAWGNVIEISGLYKNTIGKINPIRYRGYYYDTETGFYYLQSRYYDPSIGRFINSDEVATTGQGFLGCNMFAYCCNNPVSREDSDGAAFDTVFDILSLGSSIVDVIQNPNDPWAWAGLAGDVIDVAVPFVTGVGEVTRAAKVAKETAEVVDDVHDTLRAVENSSEPLTTLYRSVSNAEVDDIIATGRFNLPSGGMESKQFGLDLAETRRFGTWAGQDIIVSAQIPSRLLGQYYNGVVDPHIFRHGTITVYGDQLDAFNQAIRGTIEFLK